MMIPTKDFLNQSKTFLENQICMGMGGRIAESLVFSEITTGAASDIKNVTRLARKMVCDWGMSPLGPIAFGENQDHIFLGRDISRSQNYSEQTAQAIDAQVRKIVEDQYARAEKLIREHRAELDKVAAALIQYETIEGRHVMEIMKYGEIRSPIVLAQKSPVAPPESEKKAEGEDEALDSGTAPALA
jgi:cell division protease FtsH